MLLLCFGFLLLFCVFWIGRMWSRALPVGGARKLSDLAGEYLRCLIVVWSLHVCTSYFIDWWVNGKSGQKRHNSQLDWRLDDDIGRKHHEKWSRDALFFFTSLPLLTSAPDLQTEPLIWYRVSLHELIQSLQRQWRIDSWLTVFNLIIVKAFFVLGGWGKNKRHTKPTQYSHFVTARSHRECLSYSLTGYGDILTRRELLTFNSKKISTLRLKLAAVKASLWSCIYIHMHARALFINNSTSMVSALILIQL